MESCIQLLIVASEIPQRESGAQTHVAGVRSLADVELARLEFCVEPSNVASRAVAARLGCKFEGILRGKALIQGARRDISYSSLLLWCR
jgi:RimJ/RimL family protein N-acetyltransferase